MTDAKPSEVTRAARRKLELLVNGTASSAGPAAGGTSLPPDLLSREALDGAMAECGIQPSDPLYPFFMTLGEGMRHVSAGTEVLNARVRATADAEAERVRAAVLEIEAQSIERLTESLDRSARSLFQLTQWRTLGCLVCALAAALANGMVAGWWLGRVDGRQEVAHLEGRLAEAFRDGADGAEDWLRLMDSNDVRPALEKCREKGSKLVFESEGRKACYVPLWIEERHRTP